MVYNISFVTILYLLFQEIAFRGEKNQFAIKCWALLMLLLYDWKKKLDSYTFISMTDNLRFDFMSMSLYFIFD